MSAPAPQHRDHATAGHSPSAPRAGSGLVARLLTVVYALVITPIATGLLAYGGGGWMRYFMTRGPMSSSFSEFLATPAGVRSLLALGVGLLLLASVVATGVASSAGLVAAGALGLVSIVLSLAPMLMAEVYRITAQVLPYEFLDGLVYGLPLVLHPLMGGLGLALVIARRRPAPHIAAAVAGLVLLPLVLLLGTALLLRGLGDGAAHAMRTFEFQIIPAVVVLVLAGTLLVVLSAAASRWSPYALVVPALVALAASLAVSSPAGLTVLPGLWSQEWSTVVSFLAVGGGVAAAVVMLTHTLVLAIVRARARRRIRTLPS